MFIQLEALNVHLTMTLPLAENNSPAIIPVFFCAQSEEVNTKIISTIKRIIDLIVISFGF